MKKLESWLRVSLRYLVIIVTTFLAVWGAIHTVSYLTIQLKLERAYVTDSPVDLYVYPFLLASFFLIFSTLLSCFFVFTIKWVLSKNSDLPYWVGGATGGLFWLFYYIKSL